MVFSDIQITLDVGGFDKLTEGVCAWRGVQLKRERNVWSEMLKQDHGGTLEVITNPH